MDARPLYFVRAILQPSAAGLVRRLAAPEAVITSI